MSEAGRVTTLGCQTLGHASTACVGTSVYSSDSALFPPPPTFFEGGWGGVLGEGDHSLHTTEITSVVCSIQVSCVLHDGLIAGGTKHN